MLKRFLSSALRSLGSQTRSAEQLRARASAFRAAGDLQQAGRSYSELLELNPADVDALQQLGMLALGAQDFPRAAALFERASAIAPAIAQFHNNRGEALRRIGRIAAAIESYRTALRLDPGFAEAHNNLGVALAKSGPVDEAAACYLRAIELKPDYADACSNLALLHQARDELESAAQMLRRVVALQPGSADACNDLGSVLYRLGELAEAIRSFGRAVELQPSHARAHANLGMALLLNGDYAQGWAEYEWRLRLDGGADQHPGVTHCAWRGDDLTGRTILLDAEQGFGDSIQFVRYAPLLAARGARVILRCQPELAALLSGAAGIAEIVRFADPLPQSDFRCALLSLPHAFATTLETIPARVPYLAADPALSSQWRARLGAKAGGIRIGLNWAGRPTLPPIANRSCELAAFAPLARLPGIDWVSLQKGEQAMQAREPPPGMELLDCSEEVRDFADTAALIAGLDLVITIDTAVAHLSGAMAIPTWVLVTAVPDWRWLLVRTDNPWYPGMRVFRQKHRTEGWDRTIADVARELELLVTSTAQAGTARRIR